MTPTLGALTVHAVELAWPHTLRVQLDPSGSPASAAAALTARLTFFERPDEPQTLTLHPSGTDAADWAAADWDPASGRLHAVTFEAAPGQRLHVPDAVAAPLKGLVADDDAAYDRLYLQKTQRWGSSRTQFFLADQVCRRFSGTPAYRCAAAVICGYKAAELGDAASIAVARQHLANGPAWADELPAHVHPRRNPEHLRLSMLATCWHVDMAAGDEAACLDALEQSLRLSGGLQNNFTPAFPAARSMVLLGWMHWRAQRRPQAREAWQRATELFRRAVRDANENFITLYAELRDIQDSAILAARCLQLFEGRSEAGLALNSRRIFDRASRISGPAGQRLFAQACRWWGEPVDAPSADFKAPAPDSSRRAGPAPA